MVILIIALGLMIISPYCFGGGFRKPFFEFKINVNTAVMVMMP
jgi:hypothetical protein